MVIFNVSLHFESLISSKIEFEILCVVNKTHVLLLVTYVLYWYSFQLNGVFFC